MSGDPRLSRVLATIGLGPVLAGVLGLTLSSPRATAAPTEPGSLQQPLSPSQACSTCHEFFTPDNLANAGGSVDPWAWRGSMMGNSARDPVFWAGVALASQDHPDETVDCVRCHAPRAFLDGQGGVTELSALTEDQREGVECDACHRMIDDGETPPGNARYTIADAPEGEPVPRSGPWTYAMFGPEPQHPWAQDLDYLPSSRMCGTCHDVTTGRERVDDRGVGLGVPFNEQRTYSEWLNSDYAEQGGPDFASCQDCHMPAIEGSILGCNMFAGQPHDGGGRRHVLVGANAITMRVLKSLYGSAGTGEIDDARFDESIAWTEEFAQTSATLEVELPLEVDASAGISALAVRTINETGHKLPSGYSEGRVMWLEVTARYQGELVWSSGLWDDAQKTIEADPQVRRYEAIAERFADGKIFHLLLNDHWVVDNRLPPKGLAPNLETDPVGDRYVLQGDGTWPHFDDHSYAFAGVELEDLTPGEADELAISVRLLYLINTPEYLQVLADDNISNDAGTAVNAAFEAVGGPEPIVLAEHVASVPLVGLIGGGDGDGDGDPGDGDGDGDPGESEESGDDSTGDTGATASDTGDGGCNCRTTTHSAGSLGWLLLLPLLTRRRKSSR
ncbi:MAG TPA: MYXO-CTERM sorting domain-containing protein [Enhygromyxa sp.]|nr:MYXO-CTERM sorting domain-containing protein [Enhygromyxa sp.]